MLKVVVSADALRATSPDRKAEFIASQQSWHNSNEEARMNTLITAKTNTPVYSPNGNCDLATAAELDGHWKAGRILRFVHRKGDGAVTRAYLREGVARATPQSTSVDLGANNWWHRSNLKLLESRPQEAQ